MATDGTLTIQLTGVGGALNHAQSFVNEKGQSVDAAVPGSSTNYEIDISIKQALVKLMEIVSDHDCTLKTNDSGAPQETINLKAGNPLVWYTGSYYAIPIAGDVTKIFVTCTPAVNLSIRTVEDSSP